MPVLSLWSSGLCDISEAVGITTCSSSLCGSRPNVVPFAIVLDFLRLLQSQNTTTITIIPRIAPTATPAMAPVESPGFPEAVFGGSVETPVAEFCAEEVVSEGGRVAGSAIPEGQFL
jgi:hypothetical protein